ALGQSDIRSDVYSLGVILFVLITGRLPFAGPSPMAILRQHESAPPPIPDDLPHFVQAVLARCLAKRPEERYQRPADLVADLDEAIAQAAQASGVGSWVSGVGSWVSGSSQHLIPD